MLAAKVLPLRKIEGKYEVVRKLSEGGMGVIYLVRHRQLDELRVIKVLRSSLDSEHDLRGRFEREAKSAIRLRHPNIAQLYDFSVDEEGAAYMVMEFIDGVNLEELCRPENLVEVPLAVEISLQGLRALRFLHGKGFVHRDIAPDNLMLTRDPEGHAQVKLIDLGIVKVLRDETQKSIAGMYLGKPRYSSPEQLMGKELDGRSDLYSFGILMFELLTGRYPILGVDFPSLVTGHLHRPPLEFDEADPKGRVPAPLRALVVRALAKSPDDRFADTDDFARQLAALPIPRWEDPLGRRLSALIGGSAELTTTPHAASRRGPTQEELDRHFDSARATPSPGTIERVAAEPARPARPTISLSGIHAAISRGDLAGATHLLAAASDEDLATPEVRAVRDEIERQMAEREAQLRGAREPDSDALAWADSQVRKLIAEERSHRPAAKAEPGALAGSGATSARGNLNENARRALEGGVAEAARLLALGDTDSAAELLEGIEARTPVWEMPPALQVEFRRLEDEARSLRVAARLARANWSLEQGAAVDAEFELEKARALDRSHPAVKALAERIRAAKADTHAAFQPPPATAARPPWLLPLAVGLGVLALVLLLVAIAF